jgi:hypothetical protein
MYWVGWGRGGGGNDSRSAFPKEPGKFILFQVIEIGAVTEIIHF